MTTTATPQEIADVIIWRPALAFTGSKLAADYRREGFTAIADEYEAGIRMAANLLIQRASREGV